MIVNSLALKTEQKDLGVIMKSSYKTILCIVSVLLVKYFSIASDHMTYHFKAGSNFSIKN